MFAVPWRAGVVSWSDGILAPDLAIAAHCLKLPTTLVVEHVSRCLLRLLLRLMHTRGFVSTIQFVGPRAIRPRVHRSVVFVTHWYFLSLWLDS